MQFMLKTLTCGALLAATLSSPTSAQTWPEPGKPIHIVVPAPGGGGTGDTIARMLAEQLATRLKTSFIIENKPGANGNIGASFAAKSTPDGYRFLFSWAGTLAVSPKLYSTPGFDSQKDFSPIALICDVPNILVVNNGQPVKTLKEFVEFAKNNPGKLNFGSTGIGSSMHLAGELFMTQTGTKMVHIPYNAPGTATTNMIANDIQLMFQLIPGIASQVKAEKVRALAILSETRSPALPDVPTTTELGFPKLQSSTWFAMLAPKGTPKPIIDKMNTEINAVLKDPDFQKKLAAIGATTLGGSTEKLSSHLSAELDKWGAVIQAAGIKAQ